jgi:parallel beta-helix repeat protein
MSFIVLLALMFGSFHSVSAAPLLITVNNYIVDKNNIGGNGCNDAWPGTLNQPLCTINKGIILLHAGDTLSVRGGVYPSFLLVTKSGTAANHITIAGYNNEMPLVHGGEGIKLLGTSYIIIKGFEVTGAAGNWTAGITVANSGSVNPVYNIIEGNKVHDNTSAGMSGIKIGQGSYNKILHNEVYNNYFVGIRVSGSSGEMTGNEIGFNKVYNHTLAGGDSDGIDLCGATITNTYIHNNIVHGNSDDGIDTWDSSNNIIVGNIVYDQNGAGDGNGFKMGGADTGGNNLVKGNVAFNNKANGFHSNESGGNRYYNNVAYNNGGYGFEDGLRMNSSCTMESCPGIFINNIGYNNIKGNISAGNFTAVSHNNLWYSDSGSPKVAYDYNDYSSLSAFYSASGNRLDNPNAGNLSSLQVNPQFTNALGAVFTLKSSSPAIDKGDPANPGQIQAINLVDIGAFEATGQPTPETIYDNKNNAFVYSSGWQNVNSTKAYKGSYKTTSQKNASVKLNFTGQSISVLYVSGPNFGKIKVYVDGVWVGTINQKTAVAGYNKRWNYSGPLPLANHTLKLVFVATQINARGSLDAVTFR